MYLFYIIELRLRLDKLIVICYDVFIVIKINMSFKIYRRETYNV